MDFTVVTPSYQQLDWLARCIASVADQEGVTVEHIVQDAGSPGFPDFAEKMKRDWPDRPRYRRLMVCEADRGMYNAINQGFKKGTGKYCGHLNCDEQYLSGALAKAKKEFERFPEAEILYGGFLVVDLQGRLVTAQRPVRMSWQHVATSHLPNFTCATFFRRILLEREQAWFNEQYRFAGDAVWTLERLKKGTENHLVPEFFAAFTETGENHGMSPEGRREAMRVRDSASRWVRMAAPIWKLGHGLKKAFSGGYLPARVSYDLHMSNPVQTRSHFAMSLASPFWLSRMMKK